METTVIQYELEDSKGLWNAIVQRFRNNISRNGVIYFKGDYDREAESAFTKYCEDRGLNFIRKTFLEYSGKGPLQHPFYYLAVRDTPEYEQGFIRFNCDGGGKGTCWYKAEQIHKVTVTPSMAKIIERTDIAVKNYPIFPRVYLITRRLKELMEPLRFSGIAMTPCLESGKSYSSDEIAFLSRDERLEKESKFFN